MARRIARTKPPGWYTVAALVLLLWNLVGAWACIQQFRLGAEAMGPATAYDRALYASMPGWYNWCFALAEVTGIAGAVALLLRRTMARPLFVVSLVAVVVQFGYLFTTSDMVAVKGVWTTYFPAFIAFVGAFQVWLSDRAVRRGWIG
jgi:hypothetical protein